MDAGAFDVLEDAGDEDVLAVEDGVDLDLEAAQSTCRPAAARRAESAARDSAYDASWPSL